MYRNNGQKPDWRSRMASYIGQEAVVCENGSEYVGIVREFQHFDRWVLIVLAEASKSNYNTLNRQFVGIRSFLLQMSNRREDFTNAFVACKGGQNFMVK